MGETFHLLDEASAPPESGAYFGMGFACGSQRENPTFDGAWRSLPWRAAAGYGGPLEDTFDLGGALPEPFSDLVAGDAAIAHGDDASFHRSKVLHRFLPFGLL